MGLLGFLFGKRHFYESAIMETAKTSSLGDKTVLKEMSGCIADVKKYAEHHKMQFEHRGADILSTDEQTLMWLALADCLIKHGYAQEFDWKCGKDDFVEFMSRLKSFSILGCEINPVLLYDDDDVAAWCAAQDKVWHTKKLCIGGIDIESDSYVLFVCSVDDFERVRSVAASIHRRIARGKDM
jgi:hypothetical protein